MISGLLQVTRTGSSGDNIPDICPYLISSPVFELRSPLISCHSEKIRTLSKLTVAIVFHKTHEKSF